MLLDESSNNIDESINLDQNSDSEEEVGDNMLEGMIDNGRPSAPARTSDMMSNMKSAPQMKMLGLPSAPKEEEKPNPFKPKKKGFASTLSSAFKNFF